MSRALLLLGVLLVALPMAGCEGRPGASTCGDDCGPPAAPSGDAASDPGTTLGPAPSPSPDDSAPTAIDATLLDVLPETVRGVPVEEALEEAAVALADPTVARIGSAVDVGLALDESNGNLVTAHVVRLREGAFDDAIFRQWRDTFDDGACAAAGGVNARAEVTLDERTVFVTSCVGDLRTYHVWIVEQDLLISAASIGEGRFGELLMSALRIP